MSKQQQITDDLDALLNILPSNVREAVEKIDNSANLLEMILDLGRVPTARFVNQEVTLRDEEVTREEIDYVEENVGSFDADNRAGLERTLHRISAIRNRLGTIVGLTLRVGRAVYGTIDIIEDIVSSGKSILILGRPGVGKTTLRAKLLAFWLSPIALLWWIHPTRLAATAMCHTPLWARRAVCRCASRCFSTKS